MIKKFLLILLLLPIRLLAAPDDQIDESSLVYSHFGAVQLYRPATPPQGVVLFISGDGGWVFSAVQMARNIAKMNFIVVGVNITRLMSSLNNSKEKCLYPAGDFENLSMFLQKKLKLNKYFKPIVIGYSSGATLAYALLAQAPANTFKGAIGIGFCPDVKSSKPFCTGNGLKWQVLRPGKKYYLERFEKLTAPFIVLQGERDQVCTAREVSEFMAGMKNAEVINVPRVGHGFADQSKWLPQLKEALKKVVDFKPFGAGAGLEGVPGVSAAAIAQLPLYFIKSSPESDKPLCLIISGDGGWTDFDQSIAENLSENGICCVGLDTQKYFWEAKTPDATAKDINKVLEYYLPHLQKNNFFLLGYSFGADVIPFIANRLPDNLKKRLSLVSMLSPDDKTDFEVTISSMLNLGDENNYDVLSELKKVNFTRKICLFGSEEDDDAMEKSFKEAGAETTILAGGHHYNDNYSLIVASILKHLKAN